MFWCKICKNLSRNYFTIFFWKNMVDYIGIFFYIYQYFGPMTCWVGIYIHVSIFIIHILSAVFIGMVTGIQGIWLSKWAKMQATCMPFLSIMQFIWRQHHKNWQNHEGFCRLTVCLLRWGWGPKCVQRPNIFFF